MHHRQCSSAYLSVIVLVTTVSLAGAQSPPPGVDVLAEQVAGTAAMSSNARFVAWARSWDAAAVVIRDRQAGTTSEIAVTALAPGGVARWVSAIHGVSDDGRYIVATAYYSGTAGSEASTVRFDRSATTVVVLRQSSTSVSGIGWDPMEGTRVGVSRDGRTAAWFTGGSIGGTPGLPAAPARVMLWRDGPGDAVDIGTTCISRGPFGTVRPCVPGPAVSGDGALVMYAAGDTTAEAIAAYAVATGEKMYYPQVRPSASPASSVLATTQSGTDVLTYVGAPLEGTAALLHRPTGTVARMLEVPGAPAIGLSDDGQRILMRGDAYHDRRSGITSRLPGTDVVQISADGRHILAFAARTDGLGSDLHVIDLDADNDGMLDGWETHFGLDPANHADAGLDADGDGVGNLDEFIGRSHPTAPAVHTRLFAEGAAGGFFDTIISLFNPGTAPIDVVARFVDASGGAQASRAVQLPAKGRIDLASCCIGTLGASEFGAIVESTGPVVAERRMVWDRTTGYGSHASSGSPSASSTWYFAEGATVGGFQTFVLLQNPGPVAGTATLTFLLSDATQEVRAVHVPPYARRTVWVNQEGGKLASAEFATVVEATVPMVAERAVYLDAGGRLFAAGTNAMGATTLADHWFFAEGTTKGGFDTFILVANPGGTAADVTVRFAGAAIDGTPVNETRTYVVPPESRLTIWADETAPTLVEADFTTTVASTAPVVVERAMWWRAGHSEWIEGHAEFGAVETGVRFAIADATTVPETATDSFVLIGTPDGTPASIRLRAYPNGGAPLVAEFTTDGARTTVWMRQTFPSLVGPYAIEIESLPIGAVPATPIVVEKAIYGHNLESGAAARATRLPVP